MRKGMRRSKCARMLAAGMLLLWGAAAVAAQAPVLSKEYIRLGGRVIAIEGGPSVGMRFRSAQQVAGPGQRLHLEISPTDGGTNVQCVPTVGTCTRDTPQANNWTYRAPSPVPSNNFAVTLTATATFGTSPVSQSARILLSTTAQKIVEVVPRKATGARVTPGETVVVDLYAQAAADQTLTNPSLTNDTVLNPDGTTTVPAVIASEPGQVQYVANYVAPVGTTNLRPETLTGTVQVNGAASSSSVGLQLDGLTLQISPRQQCFLFGSQASFTATTNATANNLIYSWTRGDTGAEVRQGNTFSFPMPSGNVLVSLALVLPGDKKSKTVTALAVSPQTTCPMTMTPPYAELSAGQSKAFTVTPPENGIGSLVWSPAPQGTLQTNGLTATLTAPATVTGGLYSLLATWTGRIINAQGVPGPVETRTGLAYVRFVTALQLNVAPTYVSLLAGDTATVAVNITGGSPAINITDNLSPYGSLNTANSALLAVTALPSVDARVVRSFEVSSSAEPTQRQWVSVDFRPRVVMSLSQAPALVRAGRSAQYSANVSGARDTGVTWELTPARGSISGDGYYTAPNDVTGTEVITVTARSLVDTTKTASVQVTLRPAIGISVSPSQTTLNHGQQQQFSGTITNSSLGLNWVVVNGVGGSVSSTGLFTANNPNLGTMTATVRVEALEDPSFFVNVPVTVHGGGIVVVPASAYTGPRQAVQFSVTGGSAGTPTVVWDKASGPGTVDALTGLYTTPAVVNQNDFANVRATSTGVGGGTSSYGGVYLSPRYGIWHGEADPLNGGGPAQTFRFRVEHPSGASNVRFLKVSFKTPAAWPSPECQVRYTAPDPANGITWSTLALYWEVATPNGGAPYNTITTLESFSPISAPNCSLSAASLQQAGNILTLQVTLTLNQSLPKLQVWQYAEDNAGGVAEDVMLGTWSPAPIVTISMTPAAATVGPNGEQPLSVAIGGTTNTAKTFALSPAVGTVDPATGLYKAPLTIASTQNVTVTVTSSQDPTKTAQSVITLAPATNFAVSLTPATTSIFSGQSVTLSGYATGAANSAVRWWLVSGPGSVTQTGVYSCPAGTTGTATIRAESKADPSKFATATVTVTAPPAVTITVSPASQTMTGGGSAQFTATVTGSANTAVNWSVSPASAGSMTAGGLFTAVNPTSGTTATITAQSQADTSKTASATVTITPAVTVSLVGMNPSSLGFAERQFSVTATASSGPVNINVQAVSGGCQFTYNGGTGQLTNGSGQTGSSLSLADCTVSLDGVSVSGISTTITVTTNLYQSPNGGGVYGQAWSSSGGSTAWILMGGWY